jgi:hypothetical protein
MNSYEEKLELMLSLQEGVNSIINNQWKDAGQAWHRAIWMECAEMLDREDWKWWKAPLKFDSDAARAVHLEQQHIELSDIWHFLLSWALQEGLPATVLYPPQNAPARALQKTAMIEQMVEHAVTKNLPALLQDFHATCHA